MSLTRKAALLAFSLFLLSGVGVAHAEAFVSWSPSTSYPIEVAGSGCAVVGGEVYCVGGFDVNYNSYDNVYYAQVNSTGIGAWSMGNPYPTAVDSESCVASNSTIYCVGGEDGQEALNNVYWMQVPSSSAAPGSWVAAAAYPQPTVAASCVVYGGYIYCVGGFNSNGDEVSNTYYAALGSPGLNSWTNTTAYPKAVDSESCVASSGYIFCVAGEVESGGNPNNPINEVYYAPLSASGIGAWSAGSGYPASLAALSCAAYSGDVYCVGGFDINSLSSTDVYYATISSSGVGQWQSASPYPVDIDTTSCVLATSTIDCIGGVNGLSGGQSNVNYVYFASLGSASTTTTTPEFPVSAAIPVLLAGVLGAAALVLRRRSPV